MPAARFDHTSSGSLRDPPSPQGEGFLVAFLRTYGYGYCSIPTGDYRRNRHSGAAKDIEVGSTDNPSGLPLRGNPPPFTQGRQWCRLFPQCVTVRQQFIKLPLFVAKRPPRRVTELARALHYPSVQNRNMRYDPIHGGADGDDSSGQQRY